MNILIIEDNKPLCGLYHDFLSKAGHTVETSADGWQGFKEGVRGQYDLIISDLNMPTWDGATAIKSILEISPDTTFFVVTGYATSEIADEIRNIPQVKQVLSKPLDFKHLLNLIDEV